MPEQVERGGMTFQEARAQQRRYQRLGMHTWRVYNYLSGQERLGPQYWVYVLDRDYKEHMLRHADERIGGLRCTTI